MTVSSEFIAADCGIRQLHARFIDAVWRQDATDFSECWTRDGLWKIGGMDIAGREAIADACRRMLGRCAHIQLVTMPPILEVSGATAFGRHHMIEFSQMLDGAGAMTVGIYHDWYAAEDGRWRFARRHWEMQYRGAPDFTAAFVARPDFGSFPAMPPLDAPTYVRPA